MKTIENSFSAASLSVQSQHFLQSSAVGPADQLTNPSKTQVINCLKSFWYFCEPFMTQSATHRVCVCVMYMHAGPKACQRSRYRRTNQVPR